MIFRESSPVVERYSARDTGRESVIIVVRHRDNRLPNGTDEAKTHSAALAVRL